MDLFLLNLFLTKQEVQMFASTNPAKGRKIFMMFFILLIVFLSITAVAKEAVKTEQKASSYLDYSVFNEDEFSLIERNLLNGLKSNNEGLQISSAYFLGEMKSGKALILLLRLLSKSQTDYAKIIAAVSLYKIESEIGMYRIKWLSEFEDNEYLRKNYKRIYQAYLNKKSL